MKRSQSIQNTAIHPGQRNDRCLPTVEEEDEEEEEEEDVPDPFDAAMGMRTKQPAHKGSGGVGVLCFKDRVSDGFESTVWSIVRFNLSVSRPPSNLTWEVDSKATAEEASTPLLLVKSLLISLIDTLLLLVLLLSLLLLLLLLSMSFSSLILLLLLLLLLFVLLLLLLLSLLFDKFKKF